MPRVADTSGLYAFLNRADPHHAEAVQAVTDDDPLLVPSEVLTETIGLVQYRKGWRRARDCLSALLGLPHLRVAESVRVEAVRHVFDAGQGNLSLVDAYVVQTCRATGFPPWTYDHHLQEAAGGP